MTLTDFFHAHPKAALGFSGGVDSSYLLYAAVQSGADICPYFVKTAFQPAFELEDAMRIADQVGVKLRVVEYDILQHTEVADNLPDRCYHCKAALFGVLKTMAEADGYPLLIDGTNASDDVDDRPGMRALRELGVRSPLRECGLTKQEIREHSRQAELFTWDKPAYACLATRIPAHTRLTMEDLCRVEQAETELFTMGFRDFRVRVFHGAARLQFTAEDCMRAVRDRDELRRRLKPWFEIVLLDMKGRE